MMWTPAASAATAERHQERELALLCRLALHARKQVYLRGMSVKTPPMRAQQGRQQCPWPSRLQPPAALGTRGQLI